MHTAVRHISKAIAGAYNLLVTGFMVLDNHGIPFEFAEAGNVSCPRSYFTDTAEAERTETTNGLWFTCAFQPIRNCTPSEMLSHTEISKLDHSGSYKPKTRREIARRYLHMQPEMRAMIDEIKSKFVHTTSLPPKYAAFQIRRGNKCMWGPLNKTLCRGCEASCKHASQFLKYLPPNIDAIFVMTDDYGVIQEVQNLTTARIFTMANPNSKGGFDPTKRDSLMGLSHYGMFAQFWAELEIAVGAVRGVVSFSSNVGRVISEIRPLGLEPFFSID